MKKLTFDFSSEELESSISGGAVGCITGIPEHTALESLIKDSGYVARDFSTAVVNVRSHSGEIRSGEYPVALFYNRESGKYALCVRKEDRFGRNYALYRFDNPEDFLSSDGSFLTPRDPEE